MNFFQRRFLPLYGGLVVLLTDFFTKFFVYQMIPQIYSHSFWYPYGGLGVFKDFFGIEFSINHVTNQGGAWGIFSQYQDYLLLFRIALILLMALYLCFFNKHQARTFPLTLILAGAIGNVLDFFLYGHVIDMLHFVFWGYDYPVFNIADSSIFIGIVWLGINTLREDLFNGKQGKWESKQKNTRKMQPTKTKGRG
jgi:signal peptidase II